MKMKNYVLPQRSLSLLFFLLLLIHISPANSIAIQGVASSSGARKNPSAAPAVLMANVNWGEKSEYQQYLVASVKARLKDNDPQLEELHSDADDHRRRAPTGHSPGIGNP